ncbi:hypothetical protein [Actinoplanes sp. HUAS TT8]|uniref:hypothetical protein n=1 Tax=Actinoplanes sp. HUAS TT8 TaxID=3447453 RepID=UPI003F51AF44
MRRHGTRALVVAAVATCGTAALASPAYAAVPTITSVSVAGSATNKVVTAGSTVVITGTGFSGMVDNKDTAGSCSTTAPAVWPASPSSCSQVRFNGVGATTTAGFTLATRYSVINDTTIYATVPTVTPVDGTTGSPAAGTGSMKVQVVNTTANGTSSGISASAASEVFYRGPLTAAISPAAVNANPNGGGAITVGVSGVAALTATTFPQEKITAYVSSVVSGQTSPQVSQATVAFKDATNVTVTVPPSGASGDYAGVMLVHDGITGTADVDSLKYPAVITQINSCSADISSYISSPTTTFPTCTGSATAPSAAASTADYKITGKGLSGATAWSFDGAGGNVAETCVTISDTTAYCHIVVTAPPTSGVAPVTFTPAAVGSTSSAPALVPTPGGIVLYTTLV